jgi:microcystin-dependent protein
MSDSTTPTLGLVQPLVGGSADTWGDKENSNETLIDNWAATVNSQIAALQSQISSAIGSGYQEAVGTVKWWPSDVLPPGYAVAEGQNIAIASYPDLFNVLGTRWGGDGVNNFTMPDLRGFTLVGFDMGTGRLVGQYGPDRWQAYGGNAIITLSVSQMPPHQHGGSTDQQGNHSHNVPTPVQNQVGAIVGTYNLSIGNPAFQGYQTDAQGTHGHNFTTNSQGGGQPIGVCQPGVLGYWIMKVSTL